MTTTLTTLNDISFTSSGLQVARNDVTLQEWLQSGMEFRHYMDSVTALEKLLWGDWLNWGEAQFGDAHEAGFNIVIPPSDDQTPGLANKTVWQYKITSQRVPIDVWGLPGLSHRHYFDAATRFKDDEDGMRQHLLKVSQDRMSVREAYQLLPASSRLRPPTPTPQDYTFELEQLTHRLQQELEQSRVELAQAAFVAAKAVEALERVDAPETPAIKAEIANIPAMATLADVARKVVVCSRSHQIEAMYDAIEEMGLLLDGKSAHADTITLNGKVMEREEFFETAT